MNRSQRRKRAAHIRSKNKVICMACERPMRHRTKEHFFPKWLIEHTSATSVRLVDSGDAKWVGPNSNTVPMCRTCNETLGRHLETPVKKAFEDIEAGLGLSDLEAELLVRWLWKFEAWQWALNFSSTMNYDTVARPIDRLLGDGFEPMRDKITFSITLCHGDQYIGASGEDRGLPMGLDTPPGMYDATCEMGVFSRIAMGVGLRWSDDLLPAELTRYHFPPLDELEDREEKVVFPKVGFSDFNTAIKSMTYSGLIMKAAHEEVAEAASNGELGVRTRGLIHPVRSRLHLPPNYR